MCLHHPETIRPVQSMEKLSFMKLVPGAKKLWTAQSLRDGADMACRLWNLNCIKIGIVEDSFFL